MEEREKDREEEEETGKENIDRCDRLHFLLSLIPPTTSCPLPPAVSPHGNSAVITLSFSPWPKEKLNEDQREGLREDRRKESDR